jgi:hypothetical protein
MYLILIFLVPFLYLFNPRLAMAGLVVAIVWMCIQRTRPQQRPAQSRAASAEYEAGYK